MARCRRTTLTLLGTLVLLASPRAFATPVVLYSVDDLGGGLFRYNLAVDNNGGSEALSGLDVLNGDTVFGLDGNSAVGQPAGWSHFSPLPPLVHDLDYFSLAPGGDVPVGGVRGGFSFESTTDPNAIAGDDFAVEGIGATSASQIPLGDAELVPEPATGLLLLLGASGLAARRWRGL